LRCESPIDRALYRSPQIYLRAFTAEQGDVCNDSHSLFSLFCVTHRLQLDERERWYKAPSMKIKFFAAGGTIDKVYFDAKSAYQVGAPQVEVILSDNNVAFEYETVSALRKDSLEMNDDDRLAIRKLIESDECDHIVITHGTDTMVDTGKALVGIPNKVIVMTGAMEPARSRYTDATFNVGCAVAAVQLLAPGVYIAMNGRIYSATNVRKNYEKRIFEPS
jgi:L-asparaginase